jgi:NAD(P)-dependent dehydrogenase (short-subunit alcohol dehydrogenase family)
VRSVLVTGCSSGFGYATALAFAERGDRVFATVRKPSSGEPLVDIATKRGLDIRLVTLDVTDAASVKHGVEEALAAGDGVDVLVNNAGVAGGGPLEEQSEQTIRDLFETNTFGALRMIRAVLPAMRERRAGAIVTISSASARVSGPLLGGYAASKSALESFVEALFFEVMDFNIRVALIESGAYRTHISKNARVHVPPPDSPYRPLIQKVAATQPSSANATDPEEVVEMILAAADSPVSDHRLRFVVGEHTEALFAARDGDWSAWVERVRTDPGRR